MRELEEFRPSDLRQKLEHEVSSMKSVPAADPHHDPIMADLMKIQGRSLPIISSKKRGRLREYPPMETLSLRLQKLLELITDPLLPDDSRMHYEQLLKELISEEPRTKKGPKTYPNDYLSQILLDNYLLFLKVSTLYFNLSFSSLVTRYLVSIIYNLECWEIYHLLQAIPDFEYILKLLEFDIKNTSFGYIVKPPANFLGYNLRQGLQYPFPFPFYNFSYHTVKAKTSDRKMGTISIKPYIDLRLDKLEPAVKVNTKERGRENQKRKDKEREKENEDIYEGTPMGAEFFCMSDLEDQSEGENQDAEDAEEEEEAQRWKIVYMFVEMTPEKIQQDFDLCFLTPAQRAYEDEEYDTESAESIDAMEQEEKEISTTGLVLAPSVFQKEFSRAHDTGLIKHTFLHQCKLMDPTSQKTCLKIFYGKNELQRHQEFVHATKKRFYRCVYCLRADHEESRKCYPRYDSLARHIRRKHGIVGQENKRAITLARKAAENEESCGQLPTVTFNKLTGAPPEPLSEPRATLDSNTGKPRFPGSLQLQREQFAQHEVNPERSNNGQDMPFIVVDKTKEKPPSIKPRKRRPLSPPVPVQVPVSVPEYEMPYNEFRQDNVNPNGSGSGSGSGPGHGNVNANSWPKETANVFEYQAQHNQEKPTAGADTGADTGTVPTGTTGADNNGTGTTGTSGTTAPPHFHPYGAYAQAYGTPMYATPEGAIVYAHPMMATQGSPQQYPYMGAIYASPYAPPAPLNVERDQHPHQHHSHTQHPHHQEHPH